MTRPAPYHQFQTAAPVQPFRIAGRAALILLGLSLLTACRDSPSEVVETASEAAAKGDLVAVKEAFSVATRQRLERAWSLENSSESEGWRVLTERLTDNGKPLEVLEHAIHTDYAQVITGPTAAKRDYYLRKEDGRWKIELGAGLRYREAAAKAEAESDRKNKKSKKDD